MKKEEALLKSTSVIDSNQSLEAGAELINIDVVAESLENSENFTQTSILEEGEVDFDDQQDPSFQKEPKPFVKIKNIPKRDHLSSYFKKIQKFPMLEANEEYELAKSWQKNGDNQAKEKIIGSHLRLVFKIAQGYRGYGMPVLDLISEGHIGMMKALEKFDPTREIRFSTYAMWWIRASMKEYVMRNWSLVKTGTTSAQKKLFFKLRSMRRALLGESQKYLTREQIKHIADELNVPEKAVAEMAKRLMGNDYSLNTPIGGENEGQWQDWIEDSKENHAEKIARDDEFKKRFLMLENAFQILKPRERDIMKMRRLNAPPKTLEEIGLKLNISRERVRQIEMKAFIRVQKNVRQQVHDSKKRVGMGEISIH